MKIVHCRSWRADSCAALLACLCLAGLVRAADAASPQSEWESSPHADAESESFRHWDKEGEIPTSCASCHSMTGFLDFTGDDGTEAGKTDHPAELGSVVDCSTCHNETVKKLDQVSFPSGVAIEGTGDSSTCMICHQGRLSTVQVDEKMKGFPDDSISADLSFLNVHYRAAAASLLGTEVKGGYEYEGKSYASRFVHPEPLNSCSGCHNPHSLSVEPAQCTTCHTNADELASIRLGSADFDADGDVSVGVSVELDKLKTSLMSALTQYADEVNGKPFVYDAHTYPYFFNDLDKDGQAGEDELSYPNRYQSWTPRLVRAAYNFQFVEKDPGIWAHNPRYAAQLLIDSLTDLAGSLELSLPGYNRPG